jgi:hypothetical protein
MVFFPVVELMFVFVTRKKTLKIFANMARKTNELSVIIAGQTNIYMLKDSSYSVNFNINKIEK